MLTILGLESVLERDEADRPDPEAEGLLAARELARVAKDWAEADRLRDELAALGWQVRDGAQGPELVRP
jgi:cysteinyl-tRNA synthetase